MDKITHADERDYSIRAIDLFLCKRMTKIREMKGISPETMAKELKMTTDHLRDFETGSSRIPASVLCSMAHLLRVDLSYIFSEDVMNTA